MSITSTYQGQRAILSLADGLKRVTDFWTGNADPIIGSTPGTIELCREYGTDKIERITARTETARTFLHAMAMVFLLYVPPNEIQAAFLRLERLRPDPNRIADTDPVWVYDYRGLRPYPTAAARQLVSAQLLARLAGHTLDPGQSAEEITAAALDKLSEIVKANRSRLRLWP